MATIRSPPKPPERRSSGVLASDSIITMSEIIKPSDCDKAGYIKAGFLLAQMDICACLSGKRQVLCPESLAPTKLSVSPSDDFIRHWFSTTAEKHARRPSVTLMMDELRFQHPEQRDGGAPSPFMVGSLVTLRGQVTCAFTSSMEVLVAVTSERYETGESMELAKAFFTFVALPSVNKTLPATSVPAVIPLTASEVSRTAGIDPVSVPPFARTESDPLLNPLDRWRTCSWVVSGETSARSAARCSGSSPRAWTPRPSTTSATRRRGPS